MTKLSIITINYNNAIGLDITIQSVVPQLCSDIEYIIIDGASTDNSVEVINTYGDKINIWISEPDRGIYHAMNKGIVRASGEYLLFLNSGDILLSTISLSSFFCYMQSGKDIIYFNLYIQPKFSNSRIKEYPDKLNINYFLEDTLPHPATFIRKDLFYKYGFYDETMKICSDWSFFFKTICLHHCTYIHIDNVISVFHLDGISSDPNNELLIKKEKQFFLSRSLFPFGYALVFFLKLNKYIQRYLR